MTDRTVDTLIVGASGPIGRAVTDEFRKRGIRVATAGRSACEFDLNVSIRDQVSEFFAHHNVPRIVYLARPALERAEADIVDRTVQDFLYFVSAAAERGLERLVFASSAAVYGDQWAAPVSEGDALNGESDYAALKQGSERVLSCAARDLGFAATSLRIFNVYGPGCHGSLINRLRSGPAPDLIMSASFVRDYIHSSDVARALHAATVADQIHGAINVGTGTPTDNLALAKLVGEGKFCPRAPALEASYSVADTSRASAELDFRARIRLDAFLGRSARGVG